MATAARGELGGWNVTDGAGGDVDGGAWATGMSAGAAVGAGGAEAGVRGAAAGAGGALGKKGFSGGALAQGKWKCGAAAARGGAGEGAAVSPVEEAKEAEVASARRGVTERRPRRGVLLRVRRCAGEGG